MWDADPGESRCVHVPDLVAWIGPRHGFGAAPREERDSQNNAPEDCPDVELYMNEGRSFERDLAALSGRRGARVSFEGAARKASPSPG